MATSSIISFGARHLALFNPPVLEIGARIDPSYVQSSPRALHPGLQFPDYIGIDIEDGEGVDTVLDLTKSIDLDRLGRERFRTIHCHCVLEHVPEVSAMAAHIQDALQPGGIVFVSVPFAWRIHRIPVDMWRFTPQSLDYLFPLIDFAPEWCAFSTRAKDQFYPVTDPPELALGSALASRPWPLRVALKALRRLKLDDGALTGQRALLFESSLMFIGRKVVTPKYTFYKNGSP